MSDHDREVYDLVGAYNPLSNPPGHEGILFPFRNATTPCMFEASQLRPTPYGELFDVVLSDIEPAALSRYGAVVLVGDQNFTARKSRLLKALEEVVNVGGEILLQRYHLQALQAAGARWLDRARSQRQLTVLPERSSWRTDLPLVLSALSRRQVPVRVSSDQPLQWQINTRQAVSGSTNATIIKLVNNNGVKKCFDKPEVVLSEYDAQVILSVDFGWDVAKEWLSGAVRKGEGEISFTLRAGETAIWEFSATN